MWRAALLAPFVALGLGVTSSLLDGAVARAKARGDRIQLGSASRFDLDGDGIFSGARCDPATANVACEATPEAERAMTRVTNDTGDALAPLASATARASAAPARSLAQRLRTRRAR